MSYKDPSNPQFLISLEQLSIDAANANTTVEQYISDKGLVSSDTPIFSKKVVERGRD